MNRFRLIWLLSMGSLFFDVQAQSGGEQLKAAMLYRFVQYSEWPSAQLADPLYCVAGDAGVKQALASLLQHSNIVVRQVTKASQVEDCTVLYVAADLAKQSEWFAVFRQQGCLTVVEGAELFRKGAIFGLIVEPKRISFRVNLTAARDQGFHLSAQMLKLAKEIH